MKLDQILYIFRMMKRPMRGAVLLPIQLVIGVLHPEKKRKSFLISCKSLEKTNYETIVQFVNDSLKRCYNFNNCGENCNKCGTIHGKNSKHYKMGDLASSCAILFKTLEYKFCEVIESSEEDSACVRIFRLIKVLSFFIDKFSFFFVSARNAVFTA